MWELFDMKPRLLLLASLATILCTATGSLDISSISLQTGRGVIAAGGYMIYNGTRDASISTQYSAAWNNNNGIFYSWTGDTALDYGFGLTDSSSDHDSFRYLLRFTQLSTILPTGAVVLDVTLTLSFTNWDAHIDVDGCFLTKPWQEQPVGPEYEGTGWKFNRYDSTSMKSQLWTTPGAWGDCDNRINFVFKDIAGPYVTRSIQLDPKLVQQWVTYGDLNNYGLLFKAATGNMNVAGSQSTSATSPRPVLSISYSTSIGAVASQPQWSYPATVYSGGRTIWVSTTGNDYTGTGEKTLPYRTPHKALKDAFRGDKIYLRNGVYAGGISIERPGITIQSAPGEHAVLSLVTNEALESVNVITLRPGADDGVLRDLEIVGGFYYGIMFFTDWDWGSLDRAPYDTLGINNWLLDGLLIHDTGSSAIKMSMRSNGVTIRNCEIYNAGFREKVSGHGIDGHQALSVTVEDCYIHDLPGAGIRLEGGSVHGFVSRNYIANTQFGVVLGFGLEYEYLDWLNNPELFENINTTVVNNIIAFTQDAGIYLVAAKDAKVYFNTIWQAQQQGQSAILMASYQHADAPGAPTTRCKNVDIRNNILTKSVAVDSADIFAIRSLGFDTSSSFIMKNNLYFNIKGLVSKGGPGVSFTDETSSPLFKGSLSQWSSHCASALLSAGCESNSQEADPGLDAQFRPLACSSAVSAGISIASVTVDFHGSSRSGVDVGAVAFQAVGSSKAWPPVPASLAGVTPYVGPGQTRDQDKDWPYDYWFGRNCVDILVDPNTGSDNQQHNYASKYNTFKTIQQALVQSNQCDRILLAGGKVFTGHFGIYKPNVTIMTHPSSAVRATIRCTSNSPDDPCIMAGENCIHMTLSNFNIEMTASAAGPCIQLNEGGGSGGSPSWDFYIAAHGLGTSNDPYSTIQDLKISGCGTHGIKLSTFVTNVKIQRVEISNTGQTGIEVRNGVNLIIQDSFIHNVGGSGILLGGGARNCLVQRNTISSFGDRGILLGSDVTEPQWMDAAYARDFDPLWHDNINSQVFNNIVRDGKGAGIGFYSARDAVVSKNTFYNVASESQCGVLFDVSPKNISLTKEVGAANHNIVFSSNIVMIATPRTLMVEYRVLQGYLPSTARPFTVPEATCPAPGRKLLRGHQSTLAASSHGIASSASGTGSRTAMAPDRSLTSAKRTLLRASFARDAINMASSQGRNSDGSCPIFPDNNPWHMDISTLPVHANSESIKSHIGRATSFHPDFGGGEGKGEKAILYGIPFITVDSSDGDPALNKLNIVEYADESDPGTYPIPSDAPVEGAYANCPTRKCGGDRHVLVLDNATCTLHELYHSVPPSQSRNGLWTVGNAAKFNLSNNKLRPLGWTSADAAGLPIFPGLFKYDEAVNKGVIDHALRFTGPNSRQAYAPPATHYAPTGDRNINSPWMGMRVRLRSSFNCGALRPVARVFCVALKKYGGIFADNGSPWFWSGEATSLWSKYSRDIQDIGLITADQMDVVESGCLCLDADCMMTECTGSDGGGGGGGGGGDGGDSGGGSGGGGGDGGGGGGGDIGSPSVFDSVVPNSGIFMSNNIYYTMSGVAARYVDRVPSRAYDGSFAGWKTHVSETNSLETDPMLAADLSPLASGPAKLKQCGAL